MEKGSNLYQYLGKTCQTEHGTGEVVGIDDPESRAWRLMVKITEPSGKPIHAGMFPDKILCYHISEVKMTI